MDLERIEALLSLLNEQEVNEFSFEDEDLKLKIKLGPTVVQGVAAAAPVAIAAPAPAASAPAPASAETEAPADDLHAISSPMVGTFYRSPSPDAPPFADVGQTVKKGQVVCIVEAMKLMNEIEADVDGTIVSIEVENAQPVQFGQALVRIRPS